MRIFLTGATGYLGSAVLDACVRHGHEVTAFVRRREQATALAARGVHAVVGTLGNSSTYRAAAVGFDAYVHAAFEHSDRGAEIDRLAIDTLIAAAAERPPAALIYTSGVWVLGHRRNPADESVEPTPAAIVAWRPAHEARVLEAAARGIRPVVVRPGIVYGGARGIVADLFKDAANGLMRVIGDGQNHWALVYERDLAELYVRLVTEPRASGIYHATDEGDERVADIVEAIARVVPKPPEVRHMPIEEARQKLGPYADALALDQIVRSPRARALGWTPTLRSVAENAARLFQEWRQGQEAA
jgi:nucleoside-diphosphate-sugar epimerase